MGDILANPSHLLAFPLPGCLRTCHRNETSDRGKFSPARSTPFAFSVIYASAWMKYLEPPLMVGCEKKILEPSRCLPMRWECLRGMGTGEIRAGTKDKPCPLLAGPGWARPPGQSPQDAGPSLVPCWALLPRWYQLSHPFESHDPGPPLTLFTFSVYRSPHLWLLVLL